MHIVWSKDLEQSLVEETTKLFNVYNANFLVEMETKVEKIDIINIFDISKLLDRISGFSTNHRTRCLLLLENYVFEGTHFTFPGPCP